MKKLLKTIYSYALLFSLILTLNTIPYNVSNEITCTTSDKITCEILPLCDVPENMNNPR